MCCKRTLVWGWLLLGSVASWACSATSSEAGLQASVQLVKAYATPQGTEQGSVYFAGASEVGSFDLTRAHVVLSALELVRCDDASVASWQTWGRWLTSVPRARAHESANPLAWVQPLVVDLLATAGPSLVGVIEPPPGVYCGLQVRLAAADSDAAGLSGNEDMVGYSLWLEGTYRPQGGGAAQPVHIAGADEMQATVRFEDNLELTLDEAHRLSRVQLSVDASGLLLGVDPNDGAAVLWGRRVLQSLLDGLRVRLCPASTAASDDAGTAECVGV